MRQLQFAVWLLAFLFCSSHSLQAQFSTEWINSQTGNWNDATKWDNGVPNANSDALIHIGTVTHDNAGGTSIGKLTYDWATSDLILNTDLTVTDHLFWDKGDILGTASLVLTGTAQVNDGKLLGTVNSTADVDVNPFVFFNGAGGGGIWNNLAGSKFNLVGESDLAFDSTFNNNSGALIRKHVSSEESRFSWNLNSDGQIDVETGRLTFLGNSNFNGAINISSGATVDFGTIKNYTFQANSVVNGSGVLELSAGDTFIDHTLNVNSNMRLDGTSEIYGSGTLNINGFLDWDSTGKMKGSGVTNLNANSQIVGSSGLERTLNNFGHVDFRPFTFLAGTTSTSVWNNKSGSVLDITADKGFAFEGTFNNEEGAVFTKTAGSGNSTVSWDFNNLGGVVDAQVGSIVFNGDSNFNSEIKISSGARVDFGSIAVYSFGENGVVNGAGLFELSAGDTFVDHTLNVNSNMRLDGTSEIYGSGTLNINGFLDWDSSAKMKGSGVTNLHGGAQIVGSSGLERTLNNYGHVDFQPVTFLAGTQSTSVWNNKSGAVFDITADKGFAFEGTFNNEQGSVFRKSGGSGTSTVSWDFFNEGVIDAGSGTLRFTGDFFQGSTGQIQLSGGNVIINNWSGPFSGSFSGSGTIETAAAVVAGSLAPGNSAGTLRFTGDLEVTSLAMSFFEFGTQSDLIIVDGNLILDGSLTIDELAGFGVGEYTMFDYGGSLTDNGLEIVSAPSQFRYEVLSDVTNTRILLLVSVPEPSSLIILGGISLTVLTRRRRSAI